MSGSASAWFVRFFEPEDHIRLDIAKDVFQAHGVDAAGFFGFFGDTSSFADWPDNAAPPRWDRLAERTRAQLAVPPARGSFAGALVTGGGNFVAISLSEI
jgi:hypothetical protein